MAERMIRRNYEAMIEVLYHFGARTAELAEQIRGAADTCRTALDEEDSSISTIYENVNRCQAGYQRIALAALQIARSMSEELHQGEEELSIWSEDD